MVAPGRTEDGDVGELDNAAAIDLDCISNGDRMVLRWCSDVAYQTSTAETSQFRGVETRRSSSRVSVGADVMVAAGPHVTGV